MAFRSARIRMCRYEVRRWRSGAIADVGEAVDSPWRLTEDPSAVRRLWDAVPLVPELVWGRDELGTGEMWNSNSVIAWVITRSGIDVESIHSPAGGRAPGWGAGIAAAERGDAGAPRRTTPPRPAGAAAIFERPAGWRSGRTHRS